MQSNEFAGFGRLLDAFDSIMSEMIDVIKIVGIALAVRHIS